MEKTEKGHHSRDLEGSGAQHAGSLILGHIWCGDSFLVGLRSLSRGEDFNVLLALLDTMAERGKISGYIIERDREDDYDNDYNHHYHYCLIHANDLATTLLTPHFILVINL